MPENYSDRFWEKVAIVGNTAECWDWQAGHTTNGYGSFRVRGRTLKAHRCAWELVNGPIPFGMQVLHHCDNPPCVNPAHLFLGTHVDNMADRTEKGRVPRGEDNGSARLTENNVRAIQRLYASGLTYETVAYNFDVVKGTVGDIIRGKNWKHIA